MNISESQNTIFPRGDQAPAAYFTGNVWLKVLVPADELLNTTINNVVFEPGARTNWHTHPGGQILLVTGGTGYYQEKGEPIQHLNTADVVKILPDVEHWHGAGPNSPLTHIAMNTNNHKGGAVWLMPVTDEEYSSIK